MARITPQDMAAALRMAVEEELGTYTVVREYGARQPSDDYLPYATVQYMNSNYINDTKGKQLIMQRPFFVIGIHTATYEELGEMSDKLRYLLYYGTFDIYSKEGELLGKFSIEDFDGDEAPLTYNDYEETSERNRLYFDVSTTITTVKQTKQGGITQ